MSKIALKHIADDSGQMLTISEATIVPLGFLDLVEVIDRLEQPISFPMQLKDVRVDQGEFDNFNASAVRSVSAIVNSPFCSATIGLLNGGWLPSGLALDCSLLLPDRYTVAAIRSRFLGGFRKNGKKDDFLDLLCDRPIKINPMLYAMEDVIGDPSSQTESRLTELYEKASNKIKEALPLAIFPDKLSVVRGTLGILQDIAIEFSKKRGFLMKAAPILAPSISGARRSGVHHQLFQLANEYGIPKASILMLTVLSAAAAKQDFNPAKKLLKPKPEYTKKDARNALSDLLALDLLITAFADFPDQSVVLLTNDKDLALLWVGLNAYSFTRNNNKIRFSIKPDRRLFQSMTESEMNQMIDILYSNT
ncbi:MAG: hypothetical protein K2X63_02995 [Burkholderiaceae bacterium]|nr:hypothetical protein [Burkholderiaceae bacterium]